MPRGETVFGKPGGSSVPSYKSKSSSRRAKESRVHSPSRGSSGLERPNCSCAGANGVTSSPIPSSPAPCTRTTVVYRVKAGPNARDSSCSEKDSTTMGKSARSLYDVRAVGDPTSAVDDPGDHPTRRGRVPARPRRVVRRRARWTRDPRSTSPAKSATGSLMTPIRVRGLSGRACSTRVRTRSSR
jgi:hypothetical protein